MSENMPSQESVTYQEPSGEIADILLAPPIPYVMFDNSGKWMLLLDRVSYPPLRELAQLELRLAGIRINPKNNGQSRSTVFTGIRFLSLLDKKEVSMGGLPPEARIENVSWSPDCRWIAFTLDRGNRMELWMASADNKQGRSLGELQVNNSIPGYPYEWMPDSQGLIVTALPSDRGNAPEIASMPGGPVVQESSGVKSAVRTYQDLLRNEQDARLFEYYATSELVLIDLDGICKRLNRRGIFFNFSISPGGKFLLLETLHRPFSLQVTYDRFPTDIEIADLQGRQVRKIASVPVAENIPKGFSSVRKGPREFAWRSDASADLYWVEAQDEGDASRPAELRDRLYHLPAPFMGEAIAGPALSARFDGMQWFSGELALINESWWETRKTITSLFAPDSPAMDKRVIFERSSEDAYNDPGIFTEVLNASGKRILQSPDNGKTLFLDGQGASPEGDRPFLRKYEVDTGRITELWRSEAPYFENPYRILDPSKLLVISTRESADDPANFYLRTLGAGEPEKLTDFPHPYPQLAHVKKQVLKYSRNDGIQLTANLYLPYKEEERNKNLPILVWAYPQEFKTADAAGQVKDSPYRFMRIGWASPLFWLSRGFAVLDDPSLPIIGEGKAEPNDSYVEQLVAGAKAAVDTLVSMGVADPERVAIGGHSYGAFMTANLLAHSSLFAAGIARSGAYNRTLTPFGFQSEERTLWEAPEVYSHMSPFMFADRITAPLLLIHGEADNNPGTFPLQSERFYAALKGHAGTARLVILPFESHSYRARESVLHMLWEMDEWLQKHLSGKSSK